MTMRHMTECHMKRSMFKKEGGRQCQRKLFLIYQKKSKRAF
jgi:hypothetical protein